MYFALVSSAPDDDGGGGPGPPEPEVQGSGGAVRAPTYGGNPSEETQMKQEVRV